MFNVACGGRTTLTELHQLIGKLVESLGYSTGYKSPVYMPFRDGDIKHSLANISHIEEKLNYKPLVGLEDGLKETIKYFLS